MHTTAVCMVMLALIAGASACGNHRRHLLQEAVKPTVGLVQPGDNSAAARDLTRTYAAVMAGSTYSKTGLGSTGYGEQVRGASSSTPAIKRPSSTTKEAAVAKPTDAAVVKPTAAPVSKPTVKPAGLVWPGPIKGEENEPRL